VGRLWCCNPADSDTHRHDSDRAVQEGTGFDWWLGNDDDLFQAKARLEVSGILKGTTKQISSRISSKKSQTRQSDALGLAAFVVVVEFGTPRSRVVQR
jgi:hypothetical protein